MYGVPATFQLQSILARELTTRQRAVARSPVDSAALVRIPPTPATKRTRQSHREIDE
jgi:hypothetical protein